MIKTIFALLLTIACVGCGGYSSPSASSTPPAPGVKPAIMQIVPNTANAGDPGFTLTVNGSDFASAAVVNWNGTAQATTRMTGSQLITTIPAAAVAIAGMAPITVTNPATPGSGGMYGNGGTNAATSTSMTFTIN
jgi:hypothetical protein